MKFENESELFACAGRQFEELKVASCFGATNGLKSLPDEYVLFFMRITNDPVVDSPKGGQEGARSPSSPDSELRASPGDFCVRLVVVNKTLFSSLD